MVQNNSAFINCKICEKRFSGPEPYQQHLNSQKHKAKAGMTQDPTQPPVDDTLLHCDVCNVSISGPIPYAQHMEGSKHKSQLNKKQIVAELSCNSSGDSEQTSLGLYPNLMNVDSQPPSSSLSQVVVQKCELCGVCFSGPENMKEHIDSKGHKRKMELENWKPVLGQGLIPASAPPIQDMDANAVGDKLVPTIENAPELPDKPTKGKQQPMDEEQLTKHKKPTGCFKMSWCIPRKCKKDKKKREVGHL